MNAIPVRVDRPVVTPMDRPDVGPAEQPARASQAPALPAPPLLDVAGLSASYGKVDALLGASLQVRAGSIVTVIGPNGAGKSTLLNALMGVLKARGDIRLDGESLTRRDVVGRVMRGMALVPEKRELFADMTVADNLRLGGFRRYRAGEAQPLDQLDWVYHLFPRLKERARQLAGTLSGGERQMLAVGRALMGKPRLLMLDEPSLGLAPRIVQEVLDVVASLRGHDVSTLLVEQNARAALRVADYGYVLENGCMVLQGAASDLESHPKVVDAYLGLARPAPAPVPPSPSVLEAAR
ncbi:ABC transporter ATP-binding protein [Pigmentiphaga litoralis]|uniref:ABC transporter ATP-binding protein n=1 Tax=Pigmentiphaga litoralis TaxID=516702 RepID=UPI003B433DFC